LPRQKALGQEDTKTLIELCRSGANASVLAAKYGVSRRTVVRILGRARAEGVAVEVRQGRPKKVEVVRDDRPVVFEIVRVPISVVADLCARFHSYGSAGKISVYNFAVMEDGKPVAAFSWQPPPPGAASSVCPEAPQGVLALSRMVAVPKNERRLRHISKPLRHQMLKLIDRTRWPVLTTYSDEGQGHTGHVYKCSGWHPTIRAERIFYIDSNGKRASISTSDKHNARGLRPGGTTTLQRWEHWACGRGGAAEWMSGHGWKKVPTRHKWRSGNSASTWVKS
jgi:hypothetical protein